MSIKLLSLSLSLYLKGGGTTSGTLLRARVVLLDPECVLLLDLECVLCADAREQVPETGNSDRDVSP
jgi:hypothetical protein